MSNKTKRAKRACDLCRQRKVRCDGLPESNCTQCTSKGHVCTWTSRQNKRGRKPTSTTPTIPRSASANMIKKSPQPKRKIMDVSPMQSPDLTSSRKAKKRKTSKENDIITETNIIPKELKIQTNNSELLFSGKGVKVQKMDGVTEEHKIKEERQPVVPEIKKESVNNDVQNVNLFTNPTSNNISDEEIVENTYFDMDEDIVKQSPPMYYDCYKEIDQYSLPDQASPCVGSYNQNPYSNFLHLHSSNMMNNHNNRMIYDMNHYKPTVYNQQQYNSGLNIANLCVSIFMSYIGPIFPGFQYTYDDNSRSNWNNLIIDFEGYFYSTFKIDQLICLAKDCLVFACGTRMLSNVDISEKLMKSLESILSFIFSRFTLTPLMVDSLITICLIKTLYFISMEEKNYISNSIISLYKLTTSYSELISPITKHKILSIMMLLPEYDTVSWLENIKSLNLEANNELFNTILLSYLLTMKCLNWKGSWEDIPIKQDNISQSISSIVLQYLDKSEFSINENLSKISLEMINYFKILIYTCRATIYTITKHQDAIFWASKSLSLIKNTKFPVHCILNSLSQLAFTFKALSQHELENETNMIYKIYKRNEAFNTTIEYQVEETLVDYMRIERPISEEYGLDISDIFIYDTYYNSNCEYVTL